MQAVEKKMDMSLEDIIKANRNKSKGAKGKQPGKQQPMAVDKAAKPKAGQVAKKGGKPSASATGQSKGAAGLTINRKQGGVTKLGSAGSSMVKKSLAQKIMNKAKGKKLAPKQLSKLGPGLGKQQKQGSGVAAAAGGGGGGKQQGAGGAAQAPKQVGKAAKLAAQKQAAAGAKKQGVGKGIQLKKRVAIKAPKMLAKSKLRQGKGGNVQPKHQLSVVKQGGVNKRAPRQPIVFQTTKPQPQRQPQRQQQQGQRRQRRGNEGYQQGNDNYQQQYQPQGPRPYAGQHQQLQIPRQRGAPTAYPAQPHNQHRAAAQQYNDMGGDGYTAGQPGARRAGGLALMSEEKRIMAMHALKIQQLEDQLRKAERREFIWRQNQIMNGNTRTARPVVQQAEPVVAAGSGYGHAANARVTEHVQPAPPLAATGVGATRGMEGGGGGARHAEYAGVRSRGYEPRSTREDRYRY